MLSANVSAFSIRKAVGGGAAPIPYVLEMFVMAGGGAGGEAVFASGGGGPGEYKTHTITEPPAGLTYTISIGAGGAQQTANSDGNYGANTSLYGGGSSGTPYYIGNLESKGGGGGCSPGVSPRASGGSGGSGVAIIRYQGDQRGTGGTITSSGGYTYHTFTTSGNFTTA